MGNHYLYGPQIVFTWRSLFLSKNNCEEVLESTREDGDVEILESTRENDDEDFYSQ